MADILYVEDDKINTFIISKFLESHHHIDLAYSEEEALEKVQNREYDLLLMDIFLGQDAHDGINLLKKIREYPTYEERPVIALTAHAMSGDRERFLNAGFNAYLIKPVDRERMLETVNQLLSNGKQG